MVTCRAMSGGRNGAFAESLGEWVLYRIWFALVLAGLLAGSTLLTMSREGDADEIELSEEFLGEREHIDLGRDLFQRRCRLCHGRGAYPGKAPRLRADRLAPQDIYDRITYGFGRMPAWEDQLSDHERAAITAYMKSPLFGN